MGSVVPQEKNQKSPNGGAADRRSALLKVDLNVVAFLLSTTPWVLCTNSVVLNCQLTNNGPPVALVTSTRPSPKKFTHRSQLIRLVPSLLSWRCCGLGELGVLHAPLFACTV